MRAGKLRDRGDLQQRPDTKDSAGQRSGPWQTVRATIAADIHDDGGREYTSLLVVHGEANVVITMRGFPNWRASVKPDMRFVSTQAGVTRIFDIKAVVNPDGRNRELQLLCVEFVT